jgi:hypothetical protein
MKRPLAPVIVPPQPRRRASFALATLLLLAGCTGR